MGSGISVVGMARLAGTLSTMMASPFVSSITTRNFGGLGASLSVTEDKLLTRKLSVRSLVCVNTLSAYDYTVLSSCISVRSFARLGSRLSVFRPAVFGDDMKMRSTKTLYFDDNERTYVKATWGPRLPVQFYADDTTANVKAMTSSRKSGEYSHLHGTWQI